MPEGELGGVAINVFVGVLTGVELLLTVVGVKLGVSSGGTTGMEGMKY